MREIRTWGSARGVPGNRHPYRDRHGLCGVGFLSVDKFTAPEPTAQEPCRGYPLLPSEKENTVFTRLRAYPLFPLPGGRGWAGEPQRGNLTKPRPSGLGERDPNRYPSPEGAEQSFSIPNVPLVVGHSVRQQSKQRMNVVARASDS